MAGLRGIKTVVSERMSYILTTSSFLRLGSVVAPFSVNRGDVSLPSSLDLVPSATATDFQNIKDDSDKLLAFAGVVKGLVHAALGDQIDWIIATSAGARISPRSAFPTASSFNEAVAVMYTAISLNIGGLLDLTAAGTGADNTRTFILVADLGGGFLDVTLADKLHFGNKATARVGNYGGYPLGVDRIDPLRRFSDTTLAKSLDLWKLVRLVIAFHVWDYFDRIATDADIKYRGVILLTGGGFRRLANIPSPGEPNQTTRDLVSDLKDLIKADRPSLDLDLKVRIPNEDTKYLTLAGLGHIVDVSADDEETASDISKERPRTRGQSVLKWDSRNAGAAENWAALIGELRHAVVGA
jgi:hypothetical protein